MSAQNPLVHTALNVSRILSFLSRKCATEKHFRNGLGTKESLNTFELTGLKYGVCCTNYCTTFKKYQTFSVLIYSYINTSGNWKKTRNCDLKQHKKR